MKRAWRSPTTERAKRLRRKRELNMSLTFHEWLKRSHKWHYDALTTGANMTPTLRRELDLMMEVWRAAQAQMVEEDGDELYAELLAFVRRVVERNTDGPERELRLFAISHRNEARELVRRAEESR